MRYLIDADLITGTVSGDGVDLPSSNQAIENRRIQNGEDVDTATITEWLIDDHGRKRLPSMHPGSAWQTLNCSWNDVVIVDQVSGDWRVETDEDRLAAAKADAMRKVVDYANTVTDRILNTYPKAETAGWATKQAEAAAIIAGADFNETVVIKALVNEQTLDSAAVMAKSTAILAKAAEFAAISAAVENLRSQAQTAIDAVTDLDQIAPTLAALKDAMTAKAAELGLA